jgi:hypothetical protein
MELCSERRREVSSVHEKTDWILTACCAASPILMPLFFIGVTLMLFAIAVAGEIADNIRPEGQPIEGAR